VHLPLGILDQSPIVAGGDPDAAIAATIELVRQAEQFGYSRYWFAEHHGRQHGFASASPELLIARLAVETSRIRLGSGGVLLSHYSALKVAENFRLLEALAPGRIDLGIGRAAGGNQDAEAALRGIAGQSTPFEQLLAETLAFLGEGFPEGHPFAQVVATPVVKHVPQPWILGSGPSGAWLAAEFGLPFAYAHFIKGDGADLTIGYRSAYRPSERFPEPRVLVAVIAFCSPDPSERDDFLACLRLRRARMRLQRDPLPPTRDEARSHRPTIDEQPYFEDTDRLAIVASPTQVRTRLEDVATRHQADELMIVTVAPDYESRLRSYEAIAAECLSTEKLRLVVDQREGV